MQHALGNAIEEILAKSAGSDFIGKAQIRCCYDAHIDPLLFGAADCLDGTFCQESE